MPFFLQHILSWLKRLTLKVKTLLAADDEVLRIAHVELDGSCDLMGNLRLIAVDWLQASTMVRHGFASLLAVCVAR